MLFYYNERADYVWLVERDGGKDTLGLSYVLLDMLSCMGYMVRSGVGERVSVGEYRCEGDFVSFGGSYGDYILDCYCVLTRNWLDESLMFRDTCIYLDDYMSLKFQKGLYRSVIDFTLIFFSHCISRGITFGTRGDAYAFQRMLAREMFSWMGPLASALGNGALFSGDADFGRDFLRGFIKVFPGHERAVLLLLEYTSDSFGFDEGMRDIVSEYRSIFGKIPEEFSWLL